MNRMIAPIAKAGFGGFVRLSAKGCPTINCPVRTAEDAAFAWSSYRDRWDVTGSTMKRDSGRIYANDGTLVAYVSYNGRVWTPDGQLLQDIDGGIPVPEAFRAAITV